MLSIVQTKRDKLAIGYIKRGGLRYYVHLNALQIATVTYSEACQSWFINFHNISMEVHEYKTKQEVHETIKTTIMEWLGGITE